MFISLLHGKIEDLYDRYRMIQLAPSMRNQEATRLLDDSLDFASVLVEIIEQIEMEQQQTN